MLNAIKYLLERTDKRLYSISMSTSLKDLLHTIIPQQTSRKAEHHLNWKHIVGHLSEHVQLLKVYYLILLLGIKIPGYCKRYTYYLRF